MCEQTLGACGVGGTLGVVLRFCQGQALPDFEETDLGTVVCPPGLE